MYFIYAVYIPVCVPSMVEDKHIDIFFLSPNGSQKLYQITFSRQVHHHVELELEKGVRKQANVKFKVMHGHPPNSPTKFLKPVLMLTQS
jgi:hypothetical protein